MHSPPNFERLCQEVRNLIVTSFLRNHANSDLKIDDDLLAILSSLQLLRMVLELETRYAVTIDNSELTPENLGDVQLIARFVALKLNGS